VEFGAPIEGMARMAKATGLSFIAVTDHSYDLDDGLTPPSKQDPDLQKWKSFLNECSALETKGMTVVPGIEVSAGSAKGKNVHLLILNPQGFHRGRGDSGDVWFKTRPDDSVAEILGRLDPRELAIAAHPFQKVRFLEKCLLRRGNWELEDVGRAGLAGLQIFNGLIDADFRKSLKRWAGILLRGQKKFIYAGNDAHGSFNRSIQIKIPHLRLRESREQIFGFMKTGIYADETLDGAGLLSRLRDGRCFATTGPSIFFYLHDARRRYFSGDEAAGRSLALSLEMKSIPEFGKLTSAAIILGDLVTRTEREYAFKIHDYEFSFQGEPPFGEWPRRGYVRIVGETERGIAISNPIWVTH